MTPGDNRLKDLCAELPEWIRARIKAAYWYGVSDGMAAPNEPGVPFPPLPIRSVSSCKHPAVSRGADGEYFCLVCGASPLEERAE